MIAVPYVKCLHILENIGSELTYMLRALFAVSLANTITYFVGSLVLKKYRA